MLVIATAIFGGYDMLRTPKITPPIPHVCFTDGTVEPIYPWEIRIVHPNQENRRLDAYHCKMLLHRYLPEVQATLWIDGSCKLNVNPQMFTDTYLNSSDFATFKHFSRDCTYREAEACIRFRRFTPSKEAIESQMAAYRTEGLPEHSGMIEGCILLRRHTLAVNNFCELWWEEAMKYSSRFQLSFNYLVWKHNLDYTEIPVKVYRRTVKQFRHLKGDP